jgi:hypothetical protein
MRFQEIRKRSNERGGLQRLNVLNPKKMDLAVLSAAQGPTGHFILN